MSEKNNKFEIAAKEFLEKQHIWELRPFGRHKGVAKPTEPKKDELIQMIIDVYLGRIQPVPRSKRGAPVRSDTFDKKIETTMDELYARYARIPDEKKLFAEIVGGVGQNRMTARSPEAEKLENSVIYAQLEERNGRYRLLPFSSEWKEISMFVYHDTVVELGLREGDALACKVKQEEGGKDFFLESILTVNGEHPLSVERLNFEEADVYLPEKQIRLQGEGETEKFVDWFAPLGAGQRYLLSAPPKAGKTQALKAFALALAQRKEYQIIVLLIEQSPETVAQFRRLLSEEQLVATSYGEDPEEIVYAAKCALQRAKRYAETGKDVILFVDGLVELTLAYNELAPAGSGKTPVAGLEGTAVRYGKKFFSSARNFLQDGSLTVVATAKEGSGNPAADFLAAEFADMANGRLALSDELAKKRIFPAVDFVASFSEQSEVLLGKEGVKYEREARRKIFPVLAKEKILELLLAADTPAAFLQKAEELR